MEADKIRHWRVLGEVIGIPRENSVLGRICIARFPGLGESPVPVLEQDLIGAGIDPTPGIYFLAKINLGAEKWEDAAPIDFESTPQLTDEEIDEFDRELGIQ